MWSDQYIDIPYKLGGRDRSGLDCWGLVRLVYKEQYDIDLPSFEEDYRGETNNPKLFQEIIARKRESWTSAESIVPGTVLLFRVLGTESHVGVAISDNLFLHIRQGINVTVESLSSAKWKNRLVGGFNYTPVPEIVASGVPYAFKTQSVQLPVVPGTTLQDVVGLIHAKYGIKKELNTRVKILVNSVVVPPEAYSSCVLKEQDTLEFRVLPADEQIFAMAIMVFIAYVAAPYIGQLALQAGAEAAVAAGTTLSMTSATAIYYGTMAAVTLVGAALVNAIFPPQLPPEAKDPGQATQQSMAYGSANEVRRYGTIPVILGKVRYSPPLGANSFMTFDDGGKNTYLTTMLLWGYGPLVIDTNTLKIGDTGISQFTVTDSVTLTNINDDSLSVAYFNKLYSQDIEQQNTGNELTNTSGIAAVEIADGGSLIYIGDTLANGIFQNVPLLSSTKGGFGITTSTSNGGGAVATVTITSGSLTNISLSTVGANYAVGDILYLDYESFGAYLWYTTVQDVSYQGDSEYYTTKAEYDPAKVRVTEVTTSAEEWAYSEFSTGDRVTELSAAIHFPQGLRNIKVKGDSAGETFGLTVKFALEYQTYQQYNPSDTVNEGTWSPIGSTSEISYTSTGSGTKDAFTKTYTKADLPENRYRIRARRISPSETEPNDDDRLSWATTFLLATFKQGAVEPIRFPPGVQLARSAIKILSTKEFNGSVEAFNAEVQTYAKKLASSSYTYTSGEITGVTSWDYGGTSNPADLLLYILQHPGNAEKVSDQELINRVNLTALKEWADYCDNYVDGNGQALKLEYNAVHANQKSLLDIMREVCSAGRASPAMVDGKWTVNIDKPKTAITQHFSTHNSWGFEATRTLPRLPDALKVKFFDAAQGFTEVETIVPRAGFTLDTAQVFESIGLPGITSNRLVIDHAMWHMAQAHYRREMYTLNTDIEYLVCNRGDRVKVTHDVPLWGLGSGRIQRIPATGIYDLSEDLRIETNKNYNLRFRTQTGDSSVYTVRKAFTLNTATINTSGDRIATITSSTPVPLRKDDVINISTAYAPINGIRQVLWVSDNRLSFRIAADSVVIETGTVNFTIQDGFYQTVSFTETPSDLAAGDLFLFGELNTESQDLIVIGIEATSNNCARITLMDYAPDIYTNYLSKSNPDFVFETNITLPQQGLINTFRPEHVPTITNIAVDSSSIIEVSPGIFGFTLKISLANASNTNFPLPKDTVGIQLQYGVNSSTDESTYITETYDYSIGSVNITGFIIGETYKFRVRYISTSGKVGSWSSWQTKTAAISGLPQDSIASLRVYRTTKFLNIDPTVDLLTNTVYIDEVKYFIVRVFKDNNLEVPTDIDFWTLPSEVYELREFTTTGKLEVDLTTFTSPRMSTSGVHYLVACRAITKKGVISSPSVTSYYNLTTLRPKDA